MKKFCLDFSFAKWQKVAVICFLLIVQVALILCIYIFPFFVKKVDQPTKSFIIILDAGHGGIDGGVVGSLTGVKESDLNLEITFKLKKTLTERGAKVVLTRQDKNGLYGEYSKGFKLRDMQKRRQIIQDANPDLVVSIHMNKFSDTRRSGPQVFFQRGSQNGQQFANAIQKTLNDFTNNSYTALGGDFYICQCVDVPSVIVECGFLSNNTEEKQLCDKTYQTLLVEEITKGIFAYLYSL